MTETESINNEKIWKKFLKKHWKMLILFVIIISVAVVGAILVFLWFVEDVQLTGLVPSTLGLWSMGNLVSFLLHLIFWEILFIGIPLCITAGLIIFLWWKKLPNEEKEDYKHDHIFFGNRSHRSNGSGGISFLIFIAFIIKIYLDGKWDVPFADWTFDYLVYSCISALIWVLIIVGIPLAIGGTLWLRYEMKKKA